MQKQSLFKWPPLVATIAVVAILLNGCGQDYQSEEEFIQSIHKQDTTGSDAVGTLPPVGVSMDHVAQIRLETSEMDVGVIANDKTHFAKLKVYNDGKYPLKITRIDTTCACTQGKIPPERSTIQPGGETWIDVMIDPYRIPGFDSRKVLTITSTDPERSMVQVGVTAKVDPEFALENEIDVGELKKGESIVKTVRFRQLQEDPITVSKVEPLTTGPRNPLVPGVSAELIEIPQDQWQDADKREYDITMTIGPDIPAGVFARNLMVSTDVKRLPVTRIEVTGSVVAPYQVDPIYPARATLSPDAATGGLRATATFKAASPITLTNLSAENPALQLEALPGDTPGEATLQVTLPGGGPAETLDEVVRLQVNVDGRAYDELVGVLATGTAPAHRPGDGHDH